MLTVAKVSSGSAQGYADYLEGKAGESELGDYYLKDGDRVQAPGRWAAGAGVVGQDPERPVSGAQLRTLMAVRRPDTGQPLRQVGASGQAVAALDATFSAPKSVSAVWALAGPELRAQIEAAHERAIDRALGYAVGQVRMIRERVDERSVIHTKAADLLATSWRHTTARSVGGQPPDPQLHSHVLLHAAVRRDRRTLAIDSRSWLVHQRELGAAYRTELARELAGLGFAIERGTGQGGRYFEIAGVPRQLLDRWSSRHRQVRAAIEARLEHKARAREAAAGIDGPDDEGEEPLVRLEPREERFMSLATRTSKKLITRSDLDRHWRAAAREVGVDQRQAERLRDGGDRERPAPAKPAALGEALMEFDATLEPREARAVALERSAGAALAEALEVLKVLRQEGELLGLADGSLTTRRHRARERAAVGTAERLAAGQVRALPESLVEREVRRLQARLAAGGGELADEQRQAIRLGCGERQVVIVEGQAGTGKSTVLGAIARAHQAEGRQIIVTSTAGLAAQRLAGELALHGVEAASFSTVALQRALGDGRLALEDDSTVIHDEAALASTRELHQLLGAVEAAGARLIMVGDPRQSLPVGAGGIWPYLEAAATTHQARVELTRNVRALDPDDRRDQQRFRTGDHEGAMKGYAGRHRVHIHPEPAGAEDAALEAAQADRRAGRRTLVITQTSNEHLDELNARAQAIRIEQDELGQAALPVLGRPYSLHVGDQVQLRASIHDPELGLLRNGTTGRIAGIDERQQVVEIRLDEQRVARLQAEQLERGDVRLAYVQHPFLAQGQTSDTAHLIVAEHATREGSYVALTRARQATHIHAGRSIVESDEEGVEPLAQLAEHLGRAEPDLPSIATPLAHEREIEERQTADQERTGRDGEDERREPPRHLAGLGPRPEAPERAAGWDRAATAIEAYRAAYGIDPAEESALGPEPAAGAFQQRRDRELAADEVLEALAELGRPVSRVGPLEERLRGVPGLVPEAESERSMGWEP